MARLLSTLLIIVFALQSNQAFSRTYTSLKSGNFSAGTTWVGGIAPPTSSSQIDTIIVSIGHDVILNQNFRVLQPAALISVQGTLRNFGTPTMLTMLNSSNLWVFGTFIVDSIVVVNSSFNIAGQATARSLRCEGLTVSGTGTLNINEHLFLPKDIQVTGSNTLNFGINATIHMAGGELKKSSNSNLTFNSAYDVEYIDLAYNLPTGIELSGSWLQDVIINVSTGKEILLSQDLDIADGYLRLKSGLLNINGYKLTFRHVGKIDNFGTGLLKSTKNSTLDISPIWGFLDHLEFDTSGYMLGTLIVNPISVNGATQLWVTLGSPLIITEKLEISTVGLNIRTYNLYFSEGAIIVGADSTKAIETHGGYVYADIRPGESFTYPFGFQHNVNAYTPCTITSNGNTLAKEIGISLGYGVYKMGYSGSTLDINTQSFVKRSYYTKNNGAPVNLDIELSWHGDGETPTFNRDIAYITQFRYNYWDKIPGKPATWLGSNRFSLKREGITTLTPLAIFDDSTVSIENIATKETISLYPNPVGNVLHIGNLTQSAQLTIYNTTGAAIITQQVDKNQNTINTASLPSGMYFLQLKGEDVDASGRIMKQ